MQGLYDWLLELPFVAEPYSGRSRYHAVVRAPMLRLQRTGSPGAGRRRTTGWPRPSRPAGTRRPRASTRNGSGPSSPGAGRPWTCCTTGCAPARAPRCPRPCAPGSSCSPSGRPAPGTGPGPWWTRARTPTTPYCGSGADLLAAITDHGPLPPPPPLGLLLTRAELTDRDRAAALVARAWDRFRAGELDAALSDHGRAVAVDPRSERAHQGRAVILRSLGRHEEAPRRPGPGRGDRDPPGPGRCGSAARRTGGWAAWKRP